MRIENYIHGKDGNEKALCESLEYHGEWMGDEFVTVTVHSSEPVDFQIGDYLEYRNENFSILDDPNIIKKARSGSYQEGFTYENIKLYPESARMKHIAFNDYVLPDPDAPANKIPYSSLNIFSFFAASVEDLADRLQANLDRMEPGRWAVFTPSHNRTLQRVASEISKWNNYYDGSYDVQGKTDVNVTVSGLSCWEALKLSYTSFDVSYYITGRIIVIGGTPVSTEHDFRYGKGLGLYEIERTTDESQDVVTKLYCYGSEKNIPYGYYANLGKRIKFQIRQKSEREYIARNPLLLLWVETSYQDIKKAFNDTEMFEVELEYNGIRATFRGWGDTYNYASEKDDQTLDHETVYLNFYTHQDDSAGAAFFNSVPVGGYVYVTRGMNINKLSNAFVEIPQTYDYDAALSVNRLMLPGFPEQSLFDWVRTNGGTVLNNEKGIVGWKSWSFYASKDKKDPWIMSLKADSKGVREGTATFDESSGNEIYPTIEGTGLDVVSWAEQMDDNGYLGDEPKESEKVFKMQPSTISGYEIDWNDTDGEEVSISMKDGACVGREFKMKKAQRNEDTKLWELTLERFYDSSIGRYFPYNANASGDRRLYQVMGTGNWQGTKQGDHFVALGIKLPSSYVQLAAVKLLEESLKELAKIDHYRHTYVPKVDEIYMQRQDDFIRNEYRPGHPQTKDYGTVSIHDTLRAGMQIDMSDTDLGLDHYKPYIDVLTIKEDGNNGIPTYDVVMREEKELTLQERLQSQIEGGVKEYVNLTNKGTSVYGEYISKAYEDETEYLVSFLGGLMVDGSLKSPQYKEGEWEKVKDVDSGLWTQVHTGEGLGVYEDNDGGWHIELDHATIRKMLKTKELESLKAFFGSEDYYNPEESVLAVQGNAEFSHHLSSTEFQSGFIGGKGWAIKRVEFTNALGEPETRYTLEIDNITVRNTLRVYEMIISQLRGENDNYLFSAMAEVHHYDPETGKVWLSTEGGKIYMPFRKGDYIMVQRYQPGNTGISGKDGYVTKNYELVIVDTGTGGQEDENGDRLDWVIFKNFTTQMLHDVNSPYYHPAEGEDGDYYHTEEQIEARRNAVKAYIRSQHPEYSDLTLEDKTDEEMATNVYLLPVDLIDKGDTFCRIDNESDPERKGIIGITSVGPDTPYMDIMYGRKTDPNNFLKGRIGNLEGIKSEEFGWLEGFGAYLINLYGVGKFFNAQTGEAMESRIEATNERLRSVYREKGYDINEKDNKVSNGFFQNGLDDWTPCDLYGTPLSDPAEMEYENGQWVMKHSDGFEAYSICSETVNGEQGDNLLMNGLQLEVQKTENVEITTAEGVQVLHLNNAGVVQDFSVMTANTAHKKLTVDDDEFEDPTKPETQQPEYEKCTYQYNENFQREELRRQGYSEYEIDQVITTPPFVEAINAWVEYYKSQCQQQVEYLSSAEYEVDKLYVGVRILPLTGGMLRVRFINSSTQEYDEWSVQCEPAVNWSIQTGNDHPEEGQEDTWYFPIDIDGQPRNGKFLVSYDGECYIRFVVLQNDPIDEEEHEYETLFEQNARRIRMQAKYDDKQFADWVIQYNAIIQRVTDNKHLADQALEDILGIKTNPDGTYDLPDNWFDPNYTYASWIIHTKNRMDFLFTRWDDDNNLVGYSDRTQTADFINEIIAATNEGRDIGQEYKTMWGNVSNTLHQTFNDFNDAWGDALDDGVLTAEELARLKSLYRSLTDMFNSAKEAKDTILQSEYIKDLTNSQSPKKDINDKWTALNTAYNNMDAVYNQVLEIPAGSTIDEATMKNKNLISSLNAALTAFDTALKNFDNVIFNARNYVSSELAKATKAVKDKYETDQAALDQAIKDAYQDQNVNFLSFVNDTAWSSIQAKAIFDNNGKILKDSIRTQTAELIEDAISDYGNGQFSDVTQYANGFEHFVVSLANAKESEYDYKAYKEVQESLNSFLEDNVINKSEYEAIKSLRKSLETEYKDVVSTYVKIYSDANLSASAKTALQMAYNALVAAYGTSTASSKTGAIGAIDTLIEAYESAITTQGTTKEYVRVSDATKNNVNTALATFNARMEDYKNALDTASGDINKAVAQGLVDQLKGNIDPGVLKGDPNYDYATFKTETSYGFETIAGAFDPTTKKLENISTWVQTAEGFEQEVTNARGGQASLKMRIDGIATTVTNNKTAADNAFNNINNTVIPGLVTDIGKAQTTANNSATWIGENEDRIFLISAQFDGSGNLSNTSGLVTGNGSFTTLFAAAVEDNDIVSLADLSVYVQYDETTKKIVSGIKLSADQLDFAADDIIWKLRNSWKIQNSNKKDVLYFDANGNLQIAGQITANQVNFETTGTQNTGDITNTGDIINSGDIKLLNTKKIYIKDNVGSGTYISSLTMDASNNLILGEGQCAATPSASQNLHRTYIRGHEVVMQYGINGSVNVGATLDYNGVFNVSKLKIGDATLQWVTGKGLQVNQDFYSTGSVAAYGAGATSGGGGADINISYFGVTSGKNLKLTISGQSATADLSSMFTGMGNYLPLSGGNLSGHLYLTGANASSSTSNTSQIVFGTSSDNHVAISSNTDALIINPATNSTTGQAVIGTNGKATYFTSNGNFGIGTSNPQSKLHVEGSVKAEKYYTKAASNGFYHVFTTNSSGNGGLGVANDSQSISNLFCWINSSLVVKVGNASLNANLQLFGGNDIILYTSSSSTERMRITSDGYVGIGTNSPGSYKLNVNGSGYFAENLTVASGKQIYIGDKAVIKSDTARSYAMGLRSYANDGASDLANVSNLNSILAAGTYCCQSSTSKDNQPLRGNYRLWHIVNTGTDNNSSQDSVQIALYTNSARMYLRSHTSDGFGAWNEVATTGNVVTLDTAQTNISGSKTFTGGVTVNSLSTSNGGTITLNNNGSTYIGHGYIKSSNNLAIQGDASMANNVSICAGGGKVGIGASASSSYKLYVSGTGYFTDTLNAADGFKIAKYNDTTENFHYQIGRAGYSIECLGTWPSGSDIRMKDVIGNTECSLEDVARAPIFDFTWKMGDTETPHLGTSAQYWQNVFRNAVLQGGDGMLSMDYGATALAAAVMTARTVLTHEQRIAALEAENERLRNEINELKAA